MVKRFHPAARVAFLLLVVTPWIAWFAVKPIRVMAPELLGLSCHDNGICVERSDDYDLALGLTTEAIAELNQQLGPFQKSPRVIFCATWKCAAKFGLGERSAVTVGTFGSAVSPRAWTPYYVRHELIHQLQAQNLGWLKCLFAPGWLIEGMAYTLSDDPRHPLTEPWEGFRSRFSDWFNNRDTSLIWTDAAKVN